MKILTQVPRQTAHTELTRMPRSQWNLASDESLQSLDAVSIESSDFGIIPRTLIWLFDSPRVQVGSSHSINENLPLN